MIKEKTANYQLHKSGDAMYLTFPKLDEYGELKHLFTTRWGGVSEGECASWNFGNRKADTDENIYENDKILAAILEVPPESMTFSLQSHTTNILTVTEEHMGMGVVRPRNYRDIDALITVEKKLPIMTSHADCNSIFLYDPASKAIGLAHSGWKGTLGHIGAKTVAAMGRAFGCRAKDILACLGPALCQDCFEVEDDVASLFFEENSMYETFSYSRGIKTYIDLKKIIKSDLTNIGVKEDNVFDMELCTKCHNELFFSHRGQGKGRGLMAAVMMLA